MRLESLPHAAYSPHLAPCDFYGTMVMQSAKIFFPRRIREALMNRWNAFNEHDWGYVIEVFLILFVGIVRIKEYSFLFGLVRNVENKMVLLELFCKVHTFLQ